MNLRERIIPLPLVIECHRAGEDGETRSPGIHMVGDGLGFSFPAIVFDPDDQEEQIDKFMTALRRRLGAPDSWQPLVIVNGLSEVEPPPDLPRV